MEDELNKVLKSDMCSGCGGCTVIEPNLKMAMNNSGYQRPIKIGELDKKNKNLFNTICPGVGLDNSDKSSEKYDPLWGSVLNIYTGFSLNERYRKAGSSGGVITALSEYLISTGKVDYIINVAAKNNINNEASLRSKSFDLTKSAGSRYAPVSPVEALKLIDKNKKLNYAFIGKPCDVAAVYKLREIDTFYRDRIKYLISFFCAGTPSQNSTVELVNKLGFDVSEVERFKYRGDGWPGLAQATTYKGESASMDYNASWGNILNKSLQTRCKVCIDGIGEFADIVCADAWECDEKGYPIFEEQEGNSLIISRTRVGEQLLIDAKDVIEKKAFEISQLKLMQPFQFYRRVSIFSRVLAMLLLGLNPPQYRGFKLLKNAITGGVKLNIKSFLGILARRNKIKRDRV